MEAVSFRPTYAPVLNYDRIPPLNTVPVFVRASVQDTKRLHRLCREAKVSIGAGCFALAAIIMMEAYELREPDVPPSQRKPFITGFPINPRPFFKHQVQPDSLMLAFSDGILLPFLSRDLDLNGRIRLLAKQAHRQLAAYQKRQRPRDAEDALQYMGSRGAGRVLAIQYLASIERADAMLPKHLERGINPQGAYPTRPNETQQTCGVSSVGRIDGLIKQGMYDLNQDGEDFVADFRSCDMTVRARNGEFLVGCGGSDVDIWASCSVDATAMDPVWIEWFRRRFGTILGEDDEKGNSRL